jgi:hypothetical protein
MTVLSLLGLGALVLVALGLLAEALGSDTRDPIEDTHAAGSRS